MIFGLVAPSSGAVRFRGQDVAVVRSRRERLAFMAHVQPVFQNPFEAFNPLKRVERYLFATAHAFPGEGSVETRVASRPPPRAGTAPGCAGCDRAKVWLRRARGGPARRRGADDRRKAEGAHPATG